MNRLIKFWGDLFPGEPIIDFSIDQCPMLIGVMRGILITYDSFSPSQYIPEILLLENVLVCNDEELNLEALFYQLIVFKQEFDKNEKYLVSFFYIQ